MRSRWNVITHDYKTSFCILMSVIHLIHFCVIRFTPKWWITLFFLKTKNLDNLNLSEYLLISGRDEQRPSEGLNRRREESRKRKKRELLK